MSALAHEHVRRCPQSSLHTSRPHPVARSSRHKETALEHVLGIVAHHTDVVRFKIFSALQDGGRNVKQFFKGSTFNREMSNVTARAYIVTVADTGPSSGASAAADGLKTLLEAFQTVHKAYADAQGSPWQHAQ